MTIYFNGKGVSHNLVKQCRKCKYNFLGMWEDICCVNSIGFTLMDNCYVLNFLSVS